MVSCVEPIVHDYVAKCRIIFIVGLPRSGTTLMEQILANNPNVKSLGETNFWNRLAFELTNIQPQQYQKIVTDKILKFFKENDGSATILIDKMPINFRYVALIKKLLPHAQIVAMKREKLPLLWSIYKTSFEKNGMPFAYSIRDIVT